MDEKIEKSRKINIMKTFEGLPSWAKGVIAVATIGVTGYVLYSGYKFIQKRAESKKSKAVSDASEDMYTRLIRQGYKLTYSKEVYESAANTIEKLLSGCERVTTEIQVVKQLMKVVKNPIDWYYLVMRFGTRDVADCGTFGASKTNYDLSTLLKDQLDSVLIGDKVGDKRYFNKDTVYALDEHLSSIGITL